MNIKIQKNTIQIIIAILILQISACKEEPPIPPVNENELITTVVMEFEDSISSGKSFSIFRDIDGIGGNAPSRFDSIKLGANRTYNCRIYLLDESKNPVDSVSNEVQEEANDHLIVFTPSSVNIS